jgi:hypothetical protein
MKEYHTEIVVSASPEAVWTVLIDFSGYPEWNPLVGWLRGDFCRNGTIEMFIKPLNRSFHATIKQLQDDRAFSWVGVQGAKWFLSGEHYYRLERIDNNSTKLFHGEIFRGLGSFFISNSLLKKMEKAFHQHNQALKERVENA